MLSLMLCYLSIMGIFAATNSYSRTRTSLAPHISTIATANISCKCKYISQFLKTTCIHCNFGCFSFLVYFENRFMHIPVLGHDQ